MNVRYTVRALRHIEAIHKHVAEHDSEAAKRVVRRIERSIGRLEFFPLSGRPGVVAGTRILVVPVFRTWRSIVFAMNQSILLPYCTQPEVDGVDLIE